MPEKKDYKISWPNIIRIDNVYKPSLSLDMDKIRPLKINLGGLITEVELEAILDGSPHPVDKDTFGVREIGIKTRMQTIVFQVASLIYGQEPLPGWRGSRENFLAQLVGLIEQFIHSGRITVQLSVLDKDETYEVKRKIVLILAMNRVVQHLCSAIRTQNIEKLVPVFDSERPVKSTTEARSWYTSKPCEWTKKSHISHCVYDSNWEARAARFMDRSSLVRSFVKNDHLGFHIYYVYNGVVRKYYPDFIIRLKNSEHLILEIKGQDDQQNQIKREYLDRWVLAVNQHGGFGKWHSRVSFSPGDVESKIKECLLDS